MGLGDICCEKENRTLRQANFYQHKEIQENREDKLIWFLFITVLLSACSLSSSYLSQQKWRSPALHLGSTLCICTFLYQWLKTVFLQNLDAFHFTSFPQLPLLFGYMLFLPPHIHRFFPLFHCSHFEKLYYSSTKDKNLSK